MSVPVPPDFTPAWLAPADVLHWLARNGVLSPEDEAEVNRVCAMVELYVERCRPEHFDPAPDGTDPTYVPDAETYQGAVMYAAREIRRRNSPAGIENFADGGAAFVAKFDADIERALRTGTWARPGVG